MGEPARQLPEDDRPNIRPNLRSIDGGGETSAPTGDLHSVPSGPELERQEAGAAGEDSEQPARHLHAVPDANDDSTPADEGSGLFHPEKDSSTAPASRLGAAEAGAGIAGGAAAALTAAEGMYSGIESPRKLIGRLNWTRRKTIAGGLVGLLTGGAMFGAMIATGPLEVIHVSEMLLHSFSKTSSDSSVRTNSLFRYYRFAKTGDIGETRVGIAGSKIFAKTIKQLSDNGITFERNKFTGNVDVTKIETSKLENRYPELKDMNSAEARSFLADKLGLNKLGISPDELKLGANSSKGYVFTLEQTDYGVDVTKALNKNTLSVVDDGWTTSTIKGHVIGKFFNEPSILHPISRTVANQENKLGTKAQRAAYEREQQKALTAGLEEEAQPIQEEVKSGASGLKTAIGGGLILSAAACAIRDTADNVVKLNYAAVVAPAALEATSVIATGQQAKYGGDLPMEKLAAVKEGFYSKTGNIYGGQAFRALANLDGNGPITGTDITPDAKQAFSNDTTAEALKKNSGADTLAAGVACSPVGKVIQVALGLGLVVSGFFTAGTTWTAMAALAAAGKVAVGAVATGAAIVFLEHIASDAWSSSVVRDAAGTPLAGNLLAYGSRAAANTVAYASGGISTGANAVTQFTYNDPTSSASFRSQSLFARIFDPQDYRSLTGRLVDSLNPSWTQNITTVASSIGGVSRALPNLLSALLPKAAAAPKDTDQNYDWSFPQAGIPKFMLQESQLADPYANAASAAQLFKSDGCLGDNNTVSDCDYADRINHCFGDDLTYSKETGWDVQYVHEINPNESSYVDAHCDGIGKDWATASSSQRNWQRIVMFVNDDSTIKAVACSQGDDQSCGEFGMGATTTATSGTSGTYKNPLRDLKHLVPERIDGGVDYNADDGPIYAVGDGVVKLVQTGAASGWPGSPGAYIVYQLTDGVAQGKYVYVAEDCTPTVKVGDKLTADTTVCNYHYVHTAMELGWSDGTNDYATNDYRSHGGGYYASNTGQDFSKLLVSLGAPAGRVEGTKSSIPMPSGWPTW